MSLDSVAGSHVEVNYMLSSCRGDHMVPWACRPERKSQDRSFVFEPKKCYLYPEDQQFSWDPIGSRHLEQERFHSTF